MSYMGTDPADVSLCPVCKREIDITVLSYEHRDCQETEELSGDGLARGEEAGREPLYHRQANPARPAPHLESCCGKLFADCRCNQTVCADCGVTKAEHEFIGPERCKSPGGLHTWVLGEAA